MNQPTMNLEDIDRRTVMHPFTPYKDLTAGKITPTIITGGEGVYIQDDHGNRFLDGFGGLYCVNTGYGRTEIADAIYAQAKKLAYYHAYAGHSNEPAIRLSAKILSLAGLDMVRVYYGMSGSDANETNIKIVWYYNNVLGRPEKKKIISRHRGYHGSTIFSGSLTGLPVFHNAFDLPLGPVLHTSTPHFYRNADPGMSEQDFSSRCAQDLEELIVSEGPDTVAAFIAEPVMGTGGIIPPPQGYWERIQAVLHKYDVLLIADEVISGFGRLGRTFGSHMYDLQPDLITIAKGLTSAYLPLSGSIVGRKIWEVLESATEQYGAFGHGYTYSAHPLGAAAALANLEIVERENLIENADENGRYFLQRLHDTFDDHPQVGEVRGVGLLAALEFVADKEKRTRFTASAQIGIKIAAACRSRGLIARAMPHGDILGFAPPLCITTDEIDLMVECTKEAVNEVAQY